MNNLVIVNTTTTFKYVAPKLTIALCRDANNSLQKKVESLESKIDALSLLIEDLHKYKT